VPQNKRAVNLWGFLGICAPIGLNGQNVVLFRTEMYSTCTLNVDSVSVQTRYRWNLRFIGFPRI